VITTYLPVHTESNKPQGIDIPDIELVVQYRVPRELSTWWQRAGRAGRNLGIKATAILLAEPCFFDDEKERLAAKSTERATQKRAAEVQLQPETVKRSRNNKGSTSRRNVQASTTTGATTTTDKLKINPEMDDFINADRRPCNCRRAVTSSHFGNVGLRKFASYLRLSKSRLMFCSHQFL
jgi:superfamily II DNA/RNA helicase